MLGVYISGAITLVIYILEFVFAWTENQKVRKSIKPFCLIGLISVVAFFKYPNPLLYLALGFGLLGDIFLIWNKSKKMFLLGTLAFFINHVMYIILFATSLSYPIKPWIIIALAVFGIIFPIIPYKSVVEYTKRLTIPGCYYFYMLILECLFAGLLMFNTYSLAGVMILIGNISFIVSDTILTLSNFVFELKRKDFYIMTTYLFAQSMMAIGLCLLM